VVKHSPRKPLKKRKGDTIFQLCGRTGARECVPNFTRSGLGPNGQHSEKDSEDREDEEDEAESEGEDKDGEKGVIKLMVWADDKYPVGSLAASMIHTCSWMITWATSTRRPQANAWLLSGGYY
jgi:hypothetical protein